MRKSRYGKLIVCLRRNRSTARVGSDTGGRRSIIARSGMRFGHGSVALGFNQFGSWASRNRASILMIPGPMIFERSGWLKTMRCQKKFWTCESALSKSTAQYHTWPLKAIASRNCLRIRLQCACPILSPGLRTASFVSSIAGTELDMASRTSRAKQQRK